MPRNHFILMHKIDVQQQRYLLTIKSITPSIGKAVTQTGGRQGVKLMRNQCEPITTPHTGHCTMEEWEQRLEKTSYPVDQKNE